MGQFGLISARYAYEDVADLPQIEMRLRCQAGQVVGRAAAAAAAEGIKHICGGLLVQDSLGRYQFLEIESANELIYYGVEWVAGLIVTMVT